MIQSCSPFELYSHDVFKSTESSCTGDKGFLLDNSYWFVLIQIYHTRFEDMFDDQWQIELECECIPYPDFNHISTPALSNYFLPLKMN